MLGDPALQIYTSLLIILLACLQLISPVPLSSLFFYSDFLSFTVTFNLMDFFPLNQQFEQAFEVADLFKLYRRGKCTFACMVFDLCLYSIFRRKLSTQ